MPDMVAENYYEKDVAYQDHFEKIENRSALSSDLEIDYNTKEKRIVFSFPDEQEHVRGSVVFYRPSDSTLDFEIEINVDENQELIFNTGKLETGLWDVQVEWKADGKTFYKEKKLYL